MNITTEHDTARAAAAAAPAQAASLSRLLTGAGTPVIKIYDGTMAASAADTPSGNLLASIDIDGATIDGSTITLNTPISSLVTGADPSNGSTATWARILDAEGLQWGDVEIGEEITIDDPLLYNGAYVRITSGIFTT